MQANDLKYFIFHDDEETELKGSVTVGRHLDNDIMVAGEDVLDYHLRLEVTSRGVRAIPLGDATLTINGNHYAEPRGLISGDALQVGQDKLLMRVRREVVSEAEEWWLHGSGGDVVHRLRGRQTVGRGDDSDLLLLDDHVSRKHAGLIHDAEVIWIHDLDSANGTFVNGERITGGCRLFHGDQLAFDTVKFQLIGRGADLTPVRQQNDIPLEPSRIEDVHASDTTEIAVVEDAEKIAGLAPPQGERGTFLLGAGEPVSGSAFRIRMGRTVLGRNDDCDIVIRDRTVSARHAEMIVRPEGSTITNLMATNGTRVNGREIQSAQLVDGDVVRVGRVRLVFKDVADVGEPKQLRRAQGWLMAASLLLVVILAWLII